MVPGQMYKVDLRRKLYSKVYSRNPYDLYDRVLATVMKPGDEGIIVAITKKTGSRSDALCLTNDGALGWCWFPDECLTEVDMMANSGRTDCRT